MASEHQLLARLLDGTALRISQGLGRWGKHIELGVKGQTGLLVDAYTALLQGLQHRPCY